MADQKTLYGRDAESPSSCTETARIRVVRLSEPITRMGEAAEIARAVLDGPDDGPVILGSEIGSSRTATVGGGGPWSSVDVSSGAIEMIKNGLLAGDIIGVEGEVAGSVPMTTISGLFGMGPTHDLIGHRRNHDPRGAFTFDPVTSGADAVGMYRSLWAADAKSQRSKFVLPTHKGAVFDEKSAGKMWGLRTDLFYARNMTWSSQSLVAAITKNDVMGGSTWTGLCHADSRVKKAFWLWANSVYGMVVYWAIGTKSQQDARARLQIRGMASLQCPDFERFDDDRLDAAALYFDEFSKELLPAYLADRDGARRDLNGAASDLMGVPGYDANTLTELWCQEPTISKRGSKKRISKPAWTGSAP